MGQNLGKWGVCCRRVFEVLEKGGRRNAGERNLLLPLPLRVQGKKKTHNVIQNDIVWGFFFNSG